MATNAIFQVAFTSVMARALNPSDYGIVAIANVFLRVFSYFSQLGISTALVQKQNVSDTDVSTATTVSLAISIGFTMLATVAAPLGAAFFKIDGLTIVIAALSLNFILLGAAGISQALLRRASEFRKLAQIEVVSYVVGYGIFGIGIARYGGGQWALVGAVLAQSLIVVILGYWYTRHPIKPAHRLRITDARFFIDFGSKYSFIGFIEFLTSNIDSVTVGRAWGAVSAGYYGRANLLANLPVMLPSNLLTRVMFPILSPMKIGSEDHQRSVLFAIALVGGYASAVAVGNSWAADDIVKLLLGNKWVEAVPILKILAISAIPIYISHVISVCLDSAGALKEKLRIQILTFLAMVSSILVAYSLDTGLRGIAVGIVVAETIRLILMMNAARYTLRLTARMLMGVSSALCISAVSEILALKLASGLVLNRDPASRLVIEIFFAIPGAWLGAVISSRVVLSAELLTFTRTRFPIIASILQIR